MKYTIGGSQFTEEERSLIISTFKGNDRLLLLIRKLFIPRVDENEKGDLIDVYGDIPFNELSPEDAKSAGMARNELVKHLDKRLAIIYTLANSQPKSKEEIEKASKLDSTK
jgi:hypothetical protein